MMYQWELTIPELSGEERRRAYVYVPNSYRRDESLRYPVLYLFDGHNVFYDKDATYGKCWGMLEYLDYTDTDMIVAAVECSHSPDGGRLREYAPFSFEDPHIGKVEGRGKDTMEWLVHTFKPYIDQHYPTLPDRANTFLGGSSMGGLMSLYGVFAYNEVFSRCAALSPSLWTNCEALNQFLDTQPIAKDTVVYMDYGSREMKFHPGMLEQYIRVNSILLRRGVWVDTRIVPMGNHCEASWERQIPFFMRTLQYQP